MTLLLPLLMLSNPARALAPEYKWIVNPFSESHCALVGPDGREVRQVELWRCPQKNLTYRWYWIGRGFRCALTSTTNPQLYALVTNDACGIPYGAYYRWQRDGLGENDFACVMRVEGNDTLYVYVEPEKCPAH